MLEVSHVNVNYGKSRVITDVSFTLNRGSKLVVLGRNGVGKTTLMKCIMGLLPVEGKGTLKLENKNITKMPAYMNNQMGNHVFKCGGLQINDENKEVTVDGELIKLTPIELDIL